MKSKLFLSKLPSLLLLIFISLLQACKGGNALDNLIDGPEDGAAKTISYNPRSLSFGNSQRSPSFVDKTVQITNDSGAAIYISSFATSNSDFTVLSHDCAIKPLSLDAGSSCMVSLRFSPSVDGDITGVLITTHAASASTSVSDSLTSELGLSGRATVDGVGNAGLSFNPTSYDFGEVAPSPATQQRSFVVRNITTSNLYISGFSTNTSLFNVVSETCPDAPLPIAANATCSVVVEYEAITTGRHTGSLSATYGLNDLNPGNLEASVALSGSSNPDAPGTPAVGFSPEFYDFGDKSLSSINDQSFTLTNNSASTIFVDSIDRASGSSDFSVLSTNCPTGLNPWNAGVSCSMSVRFVPSTQTSVTANIDVTYGPTSGRDTELSARAIVSGRSSPAPISSGSISFSPTFWDYGDVARNQSVGKTVSITNGSTGAIFISSVDRTSPAQFALSNIDCPILGSGLAAGASCQVNMIFTPNADGSFATDLTLSYGATLGQASAVQAKMVLIGRSTATPIGNAALTFSPTFHDFGDIAVGAFSNQTVQISNPSGNPAIFIGSIASSSADFAVVSPTCPTGASSLAAGTSCQFTLRYLPSALGNASTDVTVSYGTDQARNTNLTRTMTAAGRSTSGGTGNNAFTFDPTYWDFGDVAAGVTTQKVILVTNSSAASVYLSNITRSNGTLFGVSHDCPISPSPLAVGASCSITASFTPIADGSQSSLISIVYGPDAPRSGEIVARVAVSGRSTAALRGNPSITYSPNFWDFGNVARNTSQDKLFTLTNASASSIYLATSNFETSGSFVITANTCPSGSTPLISGGTCAITVRFSPTADVLESTLLRTYYGPDQARSGNTLASVVITGRSIAVPSGQAILSASPSYYDFGDVAQTNSVINAVTLTNVSADSIYLSSITRSNTGAYSLTHNCPASPTAFAAGATCTINLTFSPNGEGAHSTQVTVAHGLAPASSTNLSYEFYAQGRSTAAANGNSQIAFTPSFHDYGDVAAASTSDQAITIENTSASAIYLGSVSYNNTKFSTVSNTCPTGASTLAPAATCVVTVRFAPTADGTQTGYLSYTYGPDSVRRANLVARASLAGRSTAAPIGNAALAYSPTTWDYGDVASGNTVQKAFTLTNSSSGAIHLSAVNSSSARFTVSDNCPRSPTVFAAAATCTVTVSFTPNAESGFTADISAVYGPDAARKTNLSTLLGVVGRSTSAPTGNPAVEFNPNYRDYGNLVAGTNSTLSFTLNNTTATAIYLGSASVTSAEYSITANTCPTGATALAGSGSCSISVRYTPTDEGTDIAELRMPHGPDQARASNLLSRATLIGKSEPPPVGNSALTLSPNDYDFQSVGLSPAFDTTVITVTNTSARSLYFGAMTGLTSPYSVQSTNCPVSPVAFAAAASCTVTVRFEPVAGAQVTQTLTVNYGVSTLNLSEYNSQAQFTGRSSPNPPTNFEFTSGTSTTVEFSWLANTFDQASFEIQRCDGPSCQTSFTTSATVTGIAAAVRSYQATGLTHGQVYRFRIRGISGSTQSPWLTGPATIAFGGATSVDNAGGLAASLRQINCTSANTTGTYVGLYWTPATNASYYQIYDVESGNPVWVKNVDDAAASSVVLTGLSSGVNKSYLVKAVTSIGVSSVNQTVAALVTVPYTPCAVIGQSSGTGSDYLRSLRNAAGMSSDGTRLAVADRDNHRVLIWNSIPTTDNTPPDVVLGQPDFESVTANNSGVKTSPGVVSSRGLSSPWDVYLKGGKLYVADSGNHRVLVWDTIPTSNFAPATWVMGQPTFLANNSVGCNTVNRTNGRSFSSPQAVHVDDGGYIYVSDTGYNRVLVWTTAVSANNPSADFVLGDPNMTAACAGGAVTATDLNAPSGIYVSGNDIFVADRGNHRVLRYNRATLASGMSASTVLGQANFITNTAGTGAGGPPITSSRFNNPYGVFGDDTAASTNIYVADYSNHRVLRFGSAKFATDGALADGVLGQSTLSANAASDNQNGVYNPLRGMAFNCTPSCTNSSGVWVMMHARHNFRRFDYATASAATTGLPSSNILYGQPRYGIYLDRIAGITASKILRPTAFAVGGSGADEKSVLTDFSANRALLYGAPIEANLPAATRVLGQTTMTANSVNQGGTVASNTLNGPQGAWTDGNRVIIADTANHRLLGWRSWPTTNGQAADYVIGQATFTASTAGTGTNQLSSPSSVFVSPIQGGGSNDVNIWVADRGNWRVVAYQGTWKDTAPKFPADSGGSHALVLGQPATSGAANPATPTASTIKDPRGVWSDGVSVVVADAGFHRVLIWNGATAPTTGQAADVVIGQTTLSGTVAAAGTANANVGSVNDIGLSTPTSVWVDNNRLFVVDQGNHRIMVWNSFSTLVDGQPADLVVGQSNMNSGSINGGLAYPTFNLLQFPMGLFMNAGRMFITDGFNLNTAITNPSQQAATNNRVLVLPNTWQ
jgi:hypothetical protein